MSREYIETRGYDLGYAQGFLDASQRETAQKCPYMCRYCNDETTENLEAQEAAETSRKCPECKHFNIDIDMKILCGLNGCRCANVYHKRKSNFIGSTP